MMDAQTVIMIVGLVISVAIVAITIIVNGARNRVEITNEFSGAVHRLRDQYDDRMDSLETKLVGRMDRLRDDVKGDMEIHKNAMIALTADITTQIKKIDDRLVNTQLGEQFNKGYLDNYIDERVAERMKAESS